MNKKILIIVIIALLLVGGGAGYWFMKKGSSEKSAETVKSEETTQSNVWNPYSTERHHSVTLTDQLISANNANYIVKMSITLDFNGEEAYYKYNGYDSKEDAEKAEKEGAESHSSEDVATPMELKINDTIGELMMKANAQQIKDREILRNYLKDGINRKLGFDQAIIKDLYIENFVLQ